MARMSSGERLAQAEECLVSGMTVKEWCAQNGVPAPTMYLWVRRLREERSAGLAPVFVEVAAEADRRAAGAATPIVGKRQKWRVLMLSRPWTLLTSFQGRLDGLQGRDVHDRLVRQGLVLVDPPAREPAEVGHLVRPGRVAVYAARLPEVRVVGHLRQEPFQVGTLVEAVEPGGDDDRVDRCRGLCTPRRVSENRKFFWESGVPVIVRSAWSSWSTANCTLKSQMWPFMTELAAWIGMPTTSRLGVRADARAKLAALCCN